MGGRETEPAADEGVQNVMRGGERSRRRPFSVAVAATVLGLNLALAAVLVIAFASTGEGSIGHSSAATYVLPPADAHDVFIVHDGTAYGFKDYEFAYIDSLGKQRALLVRATATDSTSEGVLTDAVGLPANSPFRVVEVDGMDRAVVACVGVGSLGTNPSEALPFDHVLIGDGPMFVSPPMAGLGFVGGSGGSVISLRVPGSNVCRFDDATVGEITQSLRALRFVSEEEWYAYTATKPPIPLASPNEFSPSRAVHFDGEDRARAQVADAISGLDVRLEDGAYPNIEGGSAPNDYGPMFLAAQEATGATPGATFVPVEIWFRSENEAIVTFRITATLPSGTATYSQTGSAVREDGRWVVSRSTVTSMLGRSGAVK